MGYSAQGETHGNWSAYCFPQPLQMYTAPGFVVAEEASFLSLFPRRNHATATIAKQSTPPKRIFHILSRTILRFMVRIMAVSFPGDACHFFFHLNKHIFRVSKKTGSKMYEHFNYSLLVNELFSLEQPQNRVENPVRSDLVRKGIRILRRSAVARHAKEVILLEM